ncbi:MAG TPA: HAD-IB family hydrolase [Solirubrobacteraceae bacterium]|nr:HAD-IB family hydrolase [Solirubrobacteraceae bacterium]
MTLAELLAEIEDGPQGPKVGAFFDFDGTLIAGYSAAAFYEDRVRRREFGVGEAVRTLLAATEMAVLGTDVNKLMGVAIANWAGRSEDEVTETFARLFHDRIAGMVYPEARELIKAHQRAGHTVALATSATRYQAAPLAEDLGVDQVLCTEVEVVQGNFSGFFSGDILWGPNKATAVKRLARRKRLQLARSYGYANGDEDVFFLEAVGNPRPLNPASGLERAAREHDWPVSRFSSRGRPGLRSTIRTGAALAGLSAAGGVGIAVGALNRSRRQAANVATAIGPDLALALAGVELNVTGAEHLWSHRPAVFIFNHQSSIDVAILGSLIRRDLTGVAKKELSRDPRFALIGFIADIAYIDRANSAQARAALEPAVEKLRSGVSIAIAPEGTRSATRRLGRFKKGAFHLAMQAGVPIVPIVIRNAGDVMWRGSVLIRPGTVDVAVLPPVSTDEWTAGELGARVDEVRDQFLETLEDWPSRSSDDTL